MKRIGFIFIAVFAVIAMVSCGSNFSLRGHHFGDSVDQVKKLEGDNWELKEDNVIQYLYCGSVYGGFGCNFSYEFKDDRLFRIFITPLISEDISAGDLFKRFKNELSTYGKPDEESELSGGYKALWKEQEYGIVLITTDSSAALCFGSEADKFEKFYSSMCITDLD